MKFHSFRKTLMLWPVVIVGLVGALVAWLAPDTSGCIGLVLEFTILGTLLLMIYDFPSKVYLFVWVGLLVAGSLIMYLANLPMDAICSLYVRHPAGMAITAGVYLGAILAEILRARVFSAYRLDAGGTLYHGDRIVFQVGRWTRAEGSRPDAVEALLIPGYGQLVLSNPRKSPDAPDEVLVIEGVRYPEKIAEEANRIARGLGAA